MTRKNGWLRTWPDREHDGVLWADGIKIGRVYQHWNYYWRWFVWTAPVTSGMADTKEEAMAAVEQHMNPDQPTVSCYPVPASLAGLQRANARRAAGGPWLR